MNEIIKCKCGIVGIWNKTKEDVDFPNILDKLQHRGRESAGMTYLDENSNFQSKKDIGLVNEVFKNDKSINSKGIIGHVRYSTSGNSKLSYEDSLNEIQPFTNDIFSLAHNGNIPDYFLKDYTNKNSDSLIIVNFLKEKLVNDNWKQTLLEFTKKFKYAYCLLILTKNSLIVIRDVFGYRPLSLGINQDNNYIVASENVAFVKYNKVRDILPGECIEISDDGINQLFHNDILKNNSNKYLQKCIFEYVYFMKPESIADNNFVYQNRFEMGRILAKEEKYITGYDYIVIGSPNTGIPGGKGYAAQMGLKYIQALRKKSDCGRTFILPSQETRMKFLKKFDFDYDDIRNQKIILVDDSIVRGNTIKSLSKFFREDCNVKEFHMRVLSPPVKFPCFYGIDIPTKEELIANKIESYNFKNENQKIQKIAEISGLDTLQYISIEGMKSIYRNDKVNFCDACFTGKYNELF